MNKPRLLGAVCAVVFSFISMSSHASLVGVLEATPGAGDWQAYYDTEADLTWLADANYAMTSGYDADGLMTWADANTWAANLDIDGVTGWRLPSSLNSDGSGPCGPGFNCNDSEMGNLFYNVLGGVALTSITTTHNSNYDLFSNVQSNDYWLSTELATDDARAWYFRFGNGRQTYGSKEDLNFYGWAVQSGSVVPVPAAVWLFGSGLLGLIGIARRKKAA